MLLGCTYKATLGVGLAASDRIGLMIELWLFVHFNEYTMVALVVKFMEEPAFDSPPTSYKLNS